MKIKNESGFTLNELMVVILIIAILLGLAVPVFIQARDRAVVRATQERLGAVVRAAQNLNSGGNEDGVEQNMSAINYADMTAAQLDAEIDAFNVITTTPPVGSKDVQLNSASPFVLTARDANEKLHTATINTSTGAVTYNN